MISPTSAWLAANSANPRTPNYRATFARSGRIYSVAPYCDYKTEVLLDVPVAYWRLGEASGSTASDSSGSGLDGTYVNSPTLGATGVLTGSSKTATTFNGSSQYMGLASGLDLNSTFTLELWFKTPSISSNCHLVSGRSDFLTIRLIGSTLVFQVWDSAYRTAQSATLLSDTWYHAVGVYDSTNGFANLYINGVAVGANVSCGAIGGSDANLYVGGRGYVPDSYFGGTLQEVAVYRSALSATRILAHYNAGRCLQRLAAPKSYMQIPRGMASQVIPEKGTASIENATFQITDVGDDVTRIFASPWGINADLVTLSMGFEGLQGEEWFDYLPGGSVLDCTMPNLTTYEITVAAPQSLTNKQAFNVSASPLRTALASGTTASLEILDASGFRPSGYIRVESELIAYSGKTEAIALNFNAQAVCCGKGLFVAVGAAGSIAWSLDGKTWVNCTSPDTSALYSAVCYSAERDEFVAVASSGTNRVAVSADGKTWVARSAAEANTWRSACWAKALGGGVGLYVAVSTDGTHQVMTSADAITWNTQSAATAGLWFRVAFAPGVGGGAGRLCAVSLTAGSTAIMTSDDSVTWTSRTPSSTSAVWTGLDWSPTLSLFCAAGYVTGTGAAKIQTSPDGITWTARTPATTPETQGDVRWSSDFGVFVESGAVVNWSTDGITWHATAYAGHNGIASGNGILVGVINLAAYVSYDAAATWATYKSTLTGLTRGVDIGRVATSPADHSAGTAVQEVLRYTGHPIDVALAVLENTDKSGCGIPAALIDTTGLAALKTALGGSYQMDILVDAPENAKQWLEREINQAHGLYPVTRSGKWGLKQIRQVAASDAVTTLSHSNIAAKSAQDSTPNMGFTPNFRSTYNAVQVLYDHNFITGNFESVKEYDDDASIKAFGKYVLVIQSKGLRSTLGGTTDLIQQTALNLLARFRNGAPLIPLNALLSKGVVEPGDVVSLTSDFLPNHLGAVRGVTGALLEVVRREPLFDQGQVAMTLQFVCWNSEITRRPAAHFTTKRPKAHPSFRTVAP